MRGTPNGDTLLSVRDLRVAFPIYGGVLRHKVAEVRAVDGVSFDLREGETLGIVGESGSGKTTVGRAIVNLLRALSPDVSLGGRILLRTEDGEIDLNGLARSKMKPYRARVQMIFQDPYASLNPRLTVQQIVERPLKLHTTMTRAKRRLRVGEILERVGLGSESIWRHPHEFSGGQRQRIGIARALATRPKLIIADEPVSALDVSVQAQVINLMEELQEDFGLTYILIAHDLGIVYHASDRIAVMYLGDVVEMGSAEQIYSDPRHPYSRALLAAVPQPIPRRQTRHVPLEGDIPSPLAKPAGCGFHSRCPIAQPECSRERPEMLELGGDRVVACPFSEEYEERLRARRR